MSDVERGRYQVATDFISVIFGLENRFQKERHFHRKPGQTVKSGIWTLPHNHAYVRIMHTEL